MTRPLIPAFLVGLLFGLGLLVSGMASPAKVIGFLDIVGAWDPSLALVMVGAIAVALPAYQWLSRRQRSLLGEPLRLPDRTSIDRRLLLGSLGFGIGWGLVGFCPGPALVALGAFELGALLFVLGMLGGMALHARLERNRNRIT